MNIARSIPLFLLFLIAQAFTPSTTSASAKITGSSSMASDVYVDLMENEIRKGIESTVSVVKPVYDSRVRSYLITYLERSRGHSEAILGKAELYFPIIEKYLEAYGLPTDLKFLAIIESALEPGATSRVGAAGIWQFMRGTGIYMGLRITKYVDERRDPERSTEAAVRYLKELYDEFGSWELAMSAYNAGPGRVRYAIRRAGTDDYWQLNRYLPRETRSYVPGFIAANYLFSNYSIHGLTPDKLPDELLHTTDVHLFDGMSFSDVNKVTGVSMNTISRLNPMYSRRYVPKSSNGYTFRLPAHAAPVLLEHLGVTPGVVDSIVAMSNYGEKAPIIVKYEMREVTETYRVVKGDNLYRISQLYGCSVDDIMTWNNLQSTSLAINQRLKIKTRERVAVYADVPQPTPSRNTFSIVPLNSLYNWKKFNTGVSLKAVPVPTLPVEEEVVSPENAVVLKRRMSLNDALIIAGKQSNIATDASTPTLVPGSVIKLQE